MAHKKVWLTRNSATHKHGTPGVKIYGGQAIKAGQIIIRQRGTHITPGVSDYGRGKDDTLSLHCDGVVEFKKKKRVLSTSLTSLLLSISFLEHSQVHSRVFRDPFFLAVPYAYRSQLLICFLMYFLTQSGKVWYSSYIAIYAGRRT